jgi:hypothetical protein
MPTSNQMDQGMIQIPKNPVLTVNLLGTVRVMAIQMLNRLRRVVSH